MIRGRRLPSLNALRTFEAVARHNGFTRAAEELNVTQSAASRLVRSLEAHLQVPLFTRQSRRIALTEAGEAYFAAVRRALDSIEAATVELTSLREGRGTLSIGMLPSFGTRWLVPRLPSFQKAHPEIALDIKSSDGDLDFVKERIDVAIRFGQGHWADAVSDFLMGEELRVVCSPRLLAGPQDATRHDAIRRHALIRHSTRPDGWDHWLRSTGAPRDDLRWGPSLEHFFMIIEAAIAGVGLALLPSYLAEDEIRAGALVELLPARVAGPGAYYLVTSAAKQGIPRVESFRAWILGQVAGGAPR